jgi:hypothetical protein
MKINKKITSLVLRVQELVMQTEKFSVSYYANIGLFSISSMNENNKYDYYESLYIDCSLHDEKFVVFKLENIIRGLEELLDETCSI